MQQVIDISWGMLALFSTTLLIPVWINRQYRLELGRDMAVGVARMTIQLILIGLYLEFVFELNLWWVNLIWVALMIAIGASAITGKAKLPRDKLFIPVSCGLLTGLTPLIALLCLVIVKPQPFYSAQYVIPLCGMLLGNSLSGNIVALQNLYTAFKQRQAEYEGALSLGASPLYASAPFVREAMQKALAPILASMTTTGLVTLPGMMTGQILGGASPLIAIKYQLVIMIAIFVMMTVSLAVSLQMSLKRTLTKEGRVIVSIEE